MSIFCATKIQLLIVGTFLDSQETRVKSKTMTCNGNDKLMLCLAMLILIVSEIQIKTVGKNGQSEKN